MVNIKKFIIISLLIFLIGYYMDISSTYMQFKYNYDRMIKGEVNCMMTERVVENGIGAVWSFGHLFSIQYLVVMVIGCLFGAKALRKFKILKDLEPKFPILLGLTMQLIGMLHFGAGIINFVALLL